MKALSKTRERRTPMEEMRKEMDRFFDDMVPFSWMKTNGPDMWSPTTDMSETEDAYLVEVDLPGATKNDIKVDYKNHRLVISGERKQEEKEEEENYLRRERYFGSFLRTFTFPEDVVEEKIKARFKDGVLKVNVPKSEKSKPKTVPID